MSMAVVLRDLEQRRTDLRAAIDAVAPALRARRPAPDRWSVELIVDHLAVVERGLVRMLGQQLRALPMPHLRDAFSFAPPPPPAPPLASARVLDRSHRITAPSSAQPRGGVDVDTAWAELQRSRLELIELARQADGRDVSAITAPHPAFGALGFWQWVEFTGLHEGRHALQIRDVAQALAGGAA